MARENAFDDFSHALSQLAGGSVLDFLRHDGFPAWIDLATSSLLERELAALERVDGGSLREQFRLSQVLALCQRLILSRHVSLLTKLRPLWRAFGSSDAKCDCIVGAVQTALDNWPHSVTIAGGSSTGLTFSTAHTVFIETLLAVANSDTAGVLGKAIRTSRLADERSHVGFPLVRYGNDSLNLRNGFWITPTKASLTSKSDSEFERRWNDLYSRVYSSTFSTLPSPRNAEVSLPDWLRQLDWDVQTFESAGFALAMQMLAWQAKVNLPFGVSFTGRWKDGQLAGVRDLAAKAIAAKEAGVFVLFACRDPNEPEPPQTEGVRIVLLPEGWRLKEVVRLVNRVCADSGLTEYRWREAQGRFLAASPTTTAHTPDLPQAIDESLCPVGFVGRDQSLVSLKQAIAANSTARPLFTVIAAARSGKTTLLSRFASQQLTYPIWFSFRRGQATRQNLSQLQEAVRDQISARFGIVPMPSHDAAVAEATKEPLVSVMDAISGAIGLLVDGIDEAQSPQEVLEWLQQVPGTGYVIVGSQPLSIFDSINCTQIAVQNDTESGHADARKLISLFAARFSNIDRLRPIAKQLSHDNWMEGLSRKAGGNLWVLTEFLSSVERDQAGWPAAPRDAPLSANVREYSQTLIAASLADYCGDNRSRVETFLAFRSFLDNRPWAVREVVRLAGDQLSNAPVSTWSGTGLLANSAGRVMEFDGSHCRFWSPLTREAVRKNYAIAAYDVARRCIHLIGNDPLHNELVEHLIASVPSLLNETNDAEVTGKLLFETSWLHQRMRMLVGQGQSVSMLRFELQSLLPSVQENRKLDVRQMVDWLAEWGWAIDKNMDLVDQWWNSAGDVTQPFPHAKVSQVTSNESSRLLAPIVGPSVADQRYEFPRPTSPRFHAAACEVLEGDLSLGPPREDLDRVDGGPRTEITTEIFGGRADGALLVCDGYTNPDNEWSRANYRFALPPFHSQSSGDVPLGPNVCITLDGWELGWNREECLLTGRRGAGQPEVRWNAAEFFGGQPLQEQNSRVRTSVEETTNADLADLGEFTERRADRDTVEILDVIASPPHGGAWIAVKCRRDVHAVLLSLDGQSAQPTVFTIWNEEESQEIDVRLQNASGSLLVYQIINRAGEPIDNGTYLNSVVQFLHLESSQPWSFHDNAPITVRQLAGKASLILRTPNFGRMDWPSGWPYTPATVYLHFPESGLVKRPDLIISRTLMVLHREEHEDESSARLASVIERDGRWTLEVCTLQIESSSELVKLQSVDVIELADQVASWSRSDDYLVLAYATGLIEVRCCHGPDKIVAVCYTTGKPDDVILIHRAEGEFLVVAGGGLSWYRLPC